jgi:adenylate cyclase class 2
MTYKQFDDDSIDGAKELEVIVSDFDTVVATLDEAGLTHDTYQESKRENWRVGDVEIMLDEWPWLDTYMEIEGPSEILVKQTAELLGLSWDDAVFGGVANVYLKQYPHIGDKGRQMINDSWPVIKFNDPMPELLSKKEGK